MRIKTLIFCAALLIATVCAFSPITVDDEHPSITFYLWYNDSSKVYEVTNATSQRHNTLARASNDAAKTGIELLAVAVYNASFEKVGWDTFAVRPKSHLMNNGTKMVRAYYAAGYLEGYLTRDRMYGRYYNEVEITKPWPADVMAFIHAQIQYMQKLGDNGHPNISKSFTDYVGNLLSQIKGLHEGYTAANQGNPDRALTYDDVYMMNLHEEAADIEEHIIQKKYGGGAEWVPDDTELLSAFPNLAQTKHQSERNQRAFRKRGGEIQDLHCSALIKVTPDDLYVGHVTWTNYQTMLRIYKTYHFTSSVTLSGYGGMIFSNDDWYMTSKGLVTMETTLMLFNNSLYKYVSEQSVAEFIRVMAANYIAQSGKEWVDTFKTQNSGTYNNQWMIVDFKQFTAGSPVTDGTLWLAEQLPGKVTTGDVSKVLRNDSYWGAYNLAYFPYVYEISGTEAQRDYYGDFFSYHKYARAEIFARNQSKVKTLSDMKALLRYNNYKYDPLSLIPNCTGTSFNNTCKPPYSSMLAIASRGDLMHPLNASDIGPQYSWLTRRDAGATDAKIALWSESTNGKMAATVICSPTYDQQPVFKWSTSPFAKENWHRIMLPDKYHFPWMEYTTKGSPPSKPSKLVGIVVGATVGAVAIVAILVMLIKIKMNKEGEEEDREALGGYSHI